MKKEKNAGPENSRMKKSFLERAVLLVALFAVTLSIFSLRTQAASATVSVSATGAKVGETVSVTVTAKSSDYIGYVYVIMSYDASILQAPTSDSISGGSGTITFIIGSDTADVKEATTTISFTALKAGTSALSIDSGTWGIDNNGDSLTLTTSNSSVTVEAAYTASTDATLSALKVTGTTSSGSSSTIALSPSFSKNTTSYTATVESNITTAVTTATANDSKATVSVSDASLSLKTGTNTITVKVTAESGATKTYTVTITKKEEETTTPEPTTEEPTTEEPTTEEPTTVVEEPILVTLLGEERILLREFDETLLPEGFEITEITWEEEIIQAAEGIYKDLTLVCTSDVNGENLKFAILQEDGTLAVLRNYQTNAVLYTILELPEAEVPEGFQTVTLTLATDYAEADEVEALQSVDFPAYYLVYAMNWDGKTGYYLYDSEEGTFQRYDLEAVEAVMAALAETTEAPTEEPTTTEPVTTPTPTDATTEELPTDDQGESGSDMWKYVLMILEAAVIAVLVAIMIRAKKEEKKSGTDPDASAPDGTVPGNDGSEDGSAGAGENDTARENGGADTGENDTATENGGVDHGDTGDNGAAFGNNDTDAGDSVMAVGNSGMAVENNGTASETDGADMPAAGNNGGTSAGEQAPDGKNTKGRKHAWTPWLDTAAANRAESANSQANTGSEGDDAEEESMSLNEYFSDFDEILSELGEDDQEE